MYRVSELGQHLPLLAPLTVDTAEYPESLYKPLGILGFVSICWLSCMHRALELLDAAQDSTAAATFAAVVRYEDLCVYRAEVVRRILQRCGLDGAAGVDDSVSAKVFDEDAHKGGGNTVSQRRSGGKKGPLFVRPKDMQGIEALLANHTRLTELDFVLPGTEANFE